ncbi:structure-specific endonuclease subunit slx1 isoform X2 [Polyergus mexicanus]|uniref:structure-specific endonuclease subunit slx1 isoform X2 n=1 Tax=Polyergus mexicanus TaxID=615972 RepID=UPI0038B5FE8D
MMKEEPEVVEHFFGVYLLYCTNPKYRGRTYIGYTVDPRRRIKQHNAGKKHGGAWKTSKKGPWNMVLIVHGFPNSTSALRFEWAWQHPHESRRLKHISKKKSTQKKFDFSLTVLSEMLKVGPWCRLPLTLRWLDYEFSESYYGCISLPLHMPICYGKVIRCKVKSRQKIKTDNILSQESTIFCFFCGSTKVFSKDGMILPIEGTCPTCETSVLWGDLIRKKNGCYQDLGETNSDFSSSDSDI